MNTATRGIVSSALALLATPAAAHGNAEFLGPVYGALLHPVIVPTEALAVTAAGLAVGFSGRRVAQVGVAVFAVALATGLLAGTVCCSDPHLDLPLVAIALVGAALVAAAVKIPILGAAPLAAAAGIAVGLDAFPEITTFGATIAAGGATLIGGTLAVTVIAGLVVERNEFWQRIAVRVAGSWIVAIAMLYLAWSITTTA